MVFNLGCQEKNIVESTCNFIKNPIGKENLPNFCTYVPFQMTPPIIGVRTVENVIKTKFLMQCDTLRSIFALH